MSTIELEIHNLTKYHSELSSQKLQNQYIITGRFGFKTKIFDDEIIDAYKIEMRLDDKFRQQLPVVREIAGRIERNINNHINKDGTCCLGVPHQIKAKLGPNFTLLEFFEFVESTLLKWISKNSVLQSSLFKYVCKSYACNTAS